MIESEEYRKGYIEGFKSGQLNICKEIKSLIENSLDVTLEDVNKVMQKISN